LFVDEAERKQRHTTFEMMEDELIYADENGMIEMVDTGSKLRFVVTKKDGREVWTNDIERAHQLLAGKIQTPKNDVEETAE
jgi:hypothetical protein